MKYGSVCSGIEAATHAWHPLGWEASFFSEIEKFPRQVLAHHYPNTPLHGDFTTIQKGDYDPIELLVGGTPCQSFSVAGLRAGLNDPRGNLMLEFGALAKRLQPKWIVWENVPGVLSSNSGKDFGSFLAMLGELGYGFAYRILDAQNFGVPQRRRRVFVVGCLGDWRSSAAVLFESESLCRDIKTSKGEGKEVTGTLTRGFGDRDLDLDQIAGGAYEIRTIAPYDKSGTLLSRDYKGIDSYDHTKRAITYTPIAYREADLANYKPDNSIGTLKKSGGCLGGGSESLVTYALAGNTIGRQPLNGGNGNGYDESSVSYTLTKTDVHAVSHKMQVRRLMPIECERLQGFRDDFTNIPGASDSTRYKALGNSMAVPVMNWIGKRIEMVEEMQKCQKKSGT